MSIKDEMVEILMPPAELIPNEVEQEILRDSCKAHVNQIKHLLRAHIHVGQLNGDKSGWMPRTAISITDELNWWLTDKRGE